MSPEPELSISKKLVSHTIFVPGIVNTDSTQNFEVLCEAAQKMVQFIFNPKRDIDIDSENFRCGGCPFLPNATLNVLSRIDFYLLGEGAEFNKKIRVTCFDTNS